MNDSGADVLQLGSRIHTPPPPSISNFWILSILFILYIACHTSPPHPVDWVITVQSFLLIDVTAAMIVSLGKETIAMLVSIAERVAMLVFNLGLSSGLKSIKPGNFKSWF